MGINRHRIRTATPARATRVDIVIPVYNEEFALPLSIPRLIDYLDLHCPYDWRVTISDNASIDRTPFVCEQIAKTDPRISVLRLERKGRGLALRSAWSTSSADIVSYMDVDLSTNLSSFMPLIAPLAAGHSDIAIGTRLGHGAIVTRQWKREFISRGYNLMIKGLFWHGFSDAQCGFKAMTGKAARELLPGVEDNGWFFDTELLLLAEELGMRIHEVPVDWIEDLDSRVNIRKTAADDIAGLLRVRRDRWARVAHRLRESTAVS